MCIRPLFASQVTYIEVLLPLLLVDNLANRVMVCTGQVDVDVALRVIDCLSLNGSALDFLSSTIT